MPAHSSKKPVRKKLITLRRLKNWTLSLVGLLIILIAISFTLIRVAIKSIPDYSNAIQQAVSKQMDLTLEVGLMDAEIYWLVPRLNLYDVNVYDKTGKHHLLHLEEIDLSLDWSDFFKTLTPTIGEITLIGLNVQLGINKDSQLLIQNFVIDENINKTIQAANQGDPAVKIEVSEAVKNNLNNLNFKILNSRVFLYDDRHKSRNKTLNDFNLHLINNESEHVFEVKANLPENYGKSVRLVIEVEGDLFDYKNLLGEVYLSVDEINAAPWLDDYWDELELSANANINAQIWLDWHAQEITSVTSRVDISGLAVHYLDEEIQTWNIKQINSLMQWEQDDTGWQLDIRDLVSDREGVSWPKPAAITIKVIDEKQEISLQADFLRIEGLSYLAGMANSVTEIDIPWVDILEQYNPSGDLKYLDVSLPVNDLKNIKINSEFSQFGFFLPESESPVIKNLEGSVLYFENKTWLVLDSKNTEFKYKKLFRDSIELRVLNGMIGISHQDNGWHISSNLLRINTPHIETKTRIKFNMQDGGRPFLDLTTKYRNGDAEYASLYLPAGVMGAKAVKWIDGALGKGKIIRGGYQFYGYLNDAPFRENQGVSLADFYVRDVDLSYLKNWPQVKGISANLRFENDTMLIKARKGKIFNSDINNARVYIDNFVSPTIDVKGKIITRLQDLKQFVNESTLKESVTDYIDNLELDGQGILDLELFLPLYGDFRTEIGGNLNILKGQILFKKENYKFTNIKGGVRFAGDMVESSDLTADLQDHKINVDVKTSQLKDGVTYQIGMQGNIAAKSLLAPVPDFKKYINGHTDWDISIDVSHFKSADETRVSAEIKSDLQGVTTDFPGPLAKPDKKPMPIEINIDVLPGSYVNYKLSIQNKLKFTLKDIKNELFILADTESIKGNMIINTSEKAEQPIKAKLDYLDLNKFFKLDQNKSENKRTTSVYKKNTAEILPEDIPSFDIQTKKLIWKEHLFTDSKLKTHKTKSGMFLEDFKFTGSDYVISGKGRWFLDWNKRHTTELEVDIKISDLGEVFKDMAISDGLMNTSGDIFLRSKWQGVPYIFDWNKLTGDGVLNLKDGTIKELNAGPGRLLGLFNFKTLFSLDFGSQMQKGFNFDKINASFTFADGNIYSDDFTVESKVADIFMDGKLSIKDDTIDQKVTVRPHLGATVSLGTAVVVSPAVGGLVYLFQKVFDTDRLSQYQYSMKGSLDNPKVELISAPLSDPDEDF